jgi:hypothetical protein
VGLHNEALGVLRARSSGDLLRLPCDSQLLGTLGHLTRACVQLSALDYVEALESRLRAYPEHFAIHFSFLCEGSVPHLLGMLALLSGRHGDAIPLLETGIGMSERAGFGPCAADARWRLALALAQRGRRPKTRAYPGQRGPGRRAELWHACARARDRAPAARLVESGVSAARSAGTDNPRDPEAYRARVRGQRFVVSATGRADPTWRVGGARRAAL